jgi:ammonia channel protein AmtB
MTPPIDILWIAICSALVFIKQAGLPKHHGRVVKLNIHPN